MIISSELMLVLNNFVFTIKALFLLRDAVL